MILEFKEQMVFCGNDSLKENVQVMFVWHENITKSGIKFPGY